jgi:cation diffusion facilitator CzcD-associated flavoprotein CzcO
MNRDTDTIIIGAGPAGLATAAALRARRVPFVLLEREGVVGSSWRRHYERLHLHTPKSHSALPFIRYPKSYPRYPSRNQFIDYLDDYARAFKIAPEFHQDVVDCRKDEADLWCVRTGQRTWRARNLVVASGFNRVPIVPSWPGQASFAGPIIHSRDYTNGERFRGKRVLVAGFGNSGAEIAIDLVEHGAEAQIAMRGHVNIIPREILGIPVTLWALASRPLSPRLADLANALSIRLAMGNLQRYGIHRRPDGPFVEIIERQHVPVIDVGTVELIKRGLIRLRPGIERFDAGDVCFCDGMRERYDAIVLATGFSTGLRQLLADVPVLDSAGRPSAYGRETSARGLYFCGYNLLPTGFLREISIEAVRIARRIAA